MVYFKRLCLGLMFVLGVSVAAACGGDGSNDNGTGGVSGTGGVPGTGGTPPKTDAVTDLCNRLDECNELSGISIQECIDITNFCLDENFPTQGLKDDWALLMNQCQEFSTCPVFVDCYFNDVPVC